MGIDFYRERSPIVTGSYFMVLTVYTLFLSHLPLLLLHVSGLILLLFLTDAHQARRIARRSLLLGLAVFIANPIFNHRGATVLFEIIGYPITLESFFVGARFGLTLTAMLLLTFLWEAWIPDRAWEALGQATLPRTFFMLRLAIGFVPALEARYEASRQAQLALGWDFNDRARQAGESMRHVIAWTMEEGLSLAQRLNSRGFAVADRRAFPALKPRPIDLMLFLVGAFLACILCFAMIHLGPARFYPVYKAWAEGRKLASVSIFWLLYYLQPFVFEMIMSARVRERRGPNAPL